MGKRMRIALLGYGKMGRELEQVALERGHAIAARVDADTPLAQAEGLVATADMAIEFSVPGLAVEHIAWCIRLGIPVVCGTTGWYDQLDRVKALVAATPKAALFVAANYSLGVAVTKQLCGSLAAFRKAHPEYQVSIREVHHTAKLDAPSGTALVLAEAFTRGDSASYCGWASPTAETPNTLAIASERRGQVPGTHEVVLDGPNDTIVIRHEAKGRRMFACGAMDAAEFLLHRTGFYGMDTLLSLDAMP